jgi:hypothetical protein
MENKAITRTVLLGVATLFVVVTASYIFATIQSDSPEQLVVGLQKAASSGEVEGFLSGLTRESRDIVEKSYADRVLLRQAQTEFLPAAEDDLRSAISRIAATEVVSKKEAADGSVELKLRTTVKTDSDKTANIENTVAARKENGEWKLSLGFPEKRLNVARIKADIERITAEVRSGRYEDRVAAMIALDNAVRAKEVK